MNSIVKQLASSTTKKIVLYCIVYTVGLIAFILFCIFMCSFITWYNGDFLYELLNLIAALLPIEVPILCIAGYIFIIYTITKKSYKSIDLMNQMIHQMISDPSKPIVLPLDLKEIQDQLNLAREQLIFSNQQALQANESKQNLLMYLAHDLKTPLTSVIGYLSLIQEEPNISEDTRNKYQQIALDKSYRIESLINEFFEITRFNIATIELSTSCINVKLLIDQLLEEFDPLFTSKQLTFNSTIEENLTLQADSEKVGRIMENILRNACNYAISNTEIQFKAYKNNDTVIFQCINQGETINPNKLKRIFDPFYRVDEARSNTTGNTGLGLSIAKQLMEAHKGSIEATSIDNTFTITLKFPTSK